LDIQKIRSVSSLKQRGAGGVFPSQPLPLIVTNHQRQADTALRSTQARRPVFLTERKDPLVIIGRGWTNLGVLAFLHLEDTSSPCNRTYRKISRQPTFFPDTPITQPVNADIAGRACFTANFNCSIAAASKSLQRFFKRLRLVWSRVQFALHGEYRHANSYITCEYMEPIPTGAPPPTEVGGFRASVTLNRSYL
jgi:hypothetical protein